MKNKKILILNAGSSSLKYSLFHGKEKKLSGNMTRIGEKGALFKNHKDVVVSLLKNINDIEVVGHRIVHGGDLNKSCIINKKVFDKVKKNSELAPLHNKPAVECISACRSKFPKVKQAAVFDTNFHKDMPLKSMIFSLPFSYLKKGYRKYGFHGIALDSLYKQARKISKAKKIIFCHLGNGCSITAVKNGKSLDTSMGFTPVNGMLMGTRAGDVDIGAIFSIMKKEKKSVDSMSEILNKKSGLSGLSGISNDMEKLSRSKSKRAKLAVDVFCYEAAKFIGSYAAVLDGAEAIVFSGGIGENSSLIRKKITNYLGYLGVKLDLKKNKKNYAVISSSNSKVKVMVFCPKEDEVILRETLKLVK